MPSVDNAFSTVRLFRKVWWIIGLCALLAIAADWVLNYILVRDERIGQENTVTLELAALRARMEEQLNTSLFLVYGMAAHIAVQKDISARQFARLAQVLLQQSQSLKNIAVAPDFVIRHVYPLEGNEAVLGLDYRTVPEQWPAALAVKQTGRMVVAGPVDLVQGGKGLIARIPVFLHDSGDFWGLVSAVIDFDDLLHTVGLDREDTLLQTAIRGKDAKGAQGEIFWGPPAVFGKSARAVTMPVVLSSGAGTWQIAAVPNGGWIENMPQRWIIHLSLLVISALACLGLISQQRNRIRLVESENRLKIMSQASHDALIMIDEKSTITFWNPAAEAMFGYTEAEAIGKDLHHLVVIPEDAEKARSGMQHFARTGEGPVLNRVMEMRAVRKSGEKFPVERSVAPFQIGGRWYAVGSVRDITDRKAAETKLTQLATTDSLTGLFNRRCFMERAEAQRLQAVRYQKPFGILMFDLDHFKRINDTHGHDTGDRVLQKVAATLLEVMRETDIVGRIGGEEFAVAMPETDPAAAAAAGERLRTRLMAESVETADGAIGFTASIGIACLTASAETLSDLMKRADDALYTAKRGGRNQVVTFQAP